MISGNVIESTGFTLQNLLIGGGNTTAVTRANYAVCSATYTTPLIKGHVYVVYFKYSYTVKQGSSKKPTWVGFWPDGGDLISSNSFNLNGATSIECYGVFQLTWQALDELYKFGTIYQGPSEQTKPATGATEGDVTGSVTNFCLFDVTELYQLTKGKYDSLDAFGKGIKDKLTFVGTNKFSVEIADNSSLRIGGDYIYGNIVEAEGLMNKDFSPNSTYGEQKYYMDENWLSIYNYKGASNKVVTHTKVEDTSNPFYPEHPYVTKIVTTNAEESTCAPNLGGFVRSWYADKTQYVIVQKLIANVPTGYDIQWNGYLGTPIYQSDTSGTGTYKEYTCIWKDWSDAGITNAGKTSMSGYVSIKPKTTGVKNVIWYVAFYGNFQFTKSNYQTYQGFSVMPNKDCIKGNTLLASKIDSQNLLPNGDGSDCKMTLPSKYQWATDINDEIEGYCCLRQPSTTDTRGDTTINGQPYIIGEPIPINPMSKYRLTYRVKAEVVPDSYLSAIVYYRKNSDGTYQVLNSNNTTYINGTRTTLAQDSDTSKNTLQLTSVDNWKTGVNYAGVGFKTNPREEFKSGDVQRTKASSKTCLVTAVDTTTKTITLVDNVQKVYKAGTYVYQSQDQSSYYYPAQRSQLKAGEWVSIKAEFGNPNQAWDGTVAAGGGAWGIPFFATHMGFAPNIYANSSGKPIYYDNIRIEEIYSCGEKRCDKVQIKRYDGERKGVINDDNKLYYLSFSQIPQGCTIKVNGWTISASNPKVGVVAGDNVSVRSTLDGIYTATSGWKYEKITGLYMSYPGLGGYMDVLLFTMPKNDRVIDVQTYSMQYYKVAIGNLTSGTAYTLYDEDFTTSSNSEIYISKQSNIFGWQISDIPANINWPYVKMTLTTPSGKVLYTVTGDVNNDGLDQGSFSIESYNEPDILFNVEVTERVNEFIIYYGGNPTGGVVTINNVTQTGNTSQIKMNAGTEVTVRYIPSQYYSVDGVTYRGLFKKYDQNCGNNNIVRNDSGVLQFTMPEHNVELYAYTTQTRAYEISYDTTSASVSTYVDSLRTSYACPGETVSVFIGYTYNNNKNYKISWSGSDRYTGNNNSVSFVMPSSDVTITASSKNSSGGGGTTPGGGDSNTWGDDEFNTHLLIIDIPNTLATRTPGINSYTEPVHTYTGVVDELTLYHDTAGFESWASQMSTLLTANEARYPTMDPNQALYCADESPCVLFAINNDDGQLETLQIQVGSDSSPAVLFDRDSVTMHSAAEIDDTFYGSWGRYQSTHIIALYTNVSYPNYIKFIANEDSEVVINFTYSMYTNDSGMQIDQFNTGFGQDQVPLAPDVTPMIDWTQAVSSTINHAYRINFVDRYWNSGSFSHIEQQIYSIYNPGGDLIQIPLSWDNPQETYITIGTVNIEYCYENDVQDVGLSNSLYVCELLDTVLNDQADRITLLGSDTGCVLMIDAVGLAGDNGWSNYTDSVDNEALYISIIYRSTLFIFVDRLVGDNQFWECPITNYFGPAGEFNSTTMPWENGVLTLKY